MNLENEIALIEAILFLESEPLELNTLVKISGLPKEAVLQGIEKLIDKYQEKDHGIELTEIGNGFLLAPKEELWNYLKDKYGKKNDNKLSKAGLETLSIIAYSQPITRAEIENIRGVSADGMIRQLLGRNFIKEVGRKDVPGKPVQYGTTKEFLKSFRLKSIADLPKLDELEADRFELNGR
jgi:segregation and condensation protein B